jgi:hypothetical protein
VRSSDTSSPSRKQVDSQLQLERRQRETLQARLKFLRSRIGAGSDPWIQNQIATTIASLAKPRAKRG